MSGRIVQEKSKESKGVLSSIRGPPFLSGLKNAGSFRIKSKTPSPAFLSITNMTSQSQRILFVFSSISQSLRGDATVTNQSTDFLRCILNDIIIGLAPS